MGRCEALIERDAGGDTSALSELVEHLWPHWIALVKASRHMGGMAKSEDHVHNVVTSLVDKLSSGALAGYPRWRAENAGKTFADWNRIVTSYAVRDYVRQALGRAKAKDPDAPSLKRLINEFASAPASDDAFGSARPAMTAAQTARQLLEFAERELPTDQMRALTMWIDGAGFEEIDEALGVSEEGAKKLVRAAVAALRRRFAGAT